MQFLSQYGVARHIYIPIIKRGVVDFAVGADWTPVAGDVKISKDGGAAANVSNLPTAITMGNTAMWDFSLVLAELQCAQALVTVSDSAAKVVEDQMFIIETYGNASAQHGFDLHSATVSLAANGITSSIMATSALDAIRDDVWNKTMTELSAVPSVTADILSGLEFMFLLGRNKRTQTSTTETLFKNDGTTVITTSTKSDDGTTFTRGKFA